MMRIYAVSYHPFLFDLGFGLFGRLANFDEKVNKPQYSRIGANMQLIFTHVL